MCVAHQNTCESLGSAGLPAIFVKMLGKLQKNDWIKRSMLGKSDRIINENKISASFQL